MAETLARKEQVEKVERTPSLKLSDPTEEKPKEAPSGPTGPPPDAEALADAWKALLALPKVATNPSLLSVFKESSRRVEGYELRVGVPSPHLVDYLRGHKEELLQFLRDQLDCPTLDMTIEVDQKATDGQPKLYTNAEKFRYLSEKYPALLALKDRLGLDLD